MNDQLSEGKAPMFILPAYDTTAIAMLGFGILAVLAAVPFLARPLSPPSIIRGRQRARTIRRRDSKSLFTGSTQRLPACSTTRTAAGCLIRSYPSVMHLHTPT